VVTFACLQDNSCCLKWTCPGASASDPELAVHVLSD